MTEVPMTENAPSPSDSVDPCTPVEAARLLGISEKRVRQLNDAGRLQSASTAPLRLTRSSVMALREERKAEAAAGGPPRSVRAPAGGMAAADVLARLEAITTAMTEQSRRAIEATEHAHRAVEGSLQESLAESRARATMLEARLEDERAARVAAEVALAEARAAAAAVPEKRSRWGRRSPGE